MLFRQHCRHADSTVGTAAHLKADLIEMIGVQAAFHRFSVFIAKLPLAVVRAQAAVVVFNVELVSSALPSRPLTLKAMVEPSPGLTTLARMR